MKRFLFTALMLLGSMSWGAANTATSTITATITQTFTVTKTPTPTPSITETFTITKTITLTSTRTWTPTVTPTFTATPSRTPNFATKTSTWTRTVTKTPTRTVFVSFTPTISATITPTHTPTASPSATPTFTQQVTRIPTPEYELLWKHVDDAATRAQIVAVVTAIALSNNGMGDVSTTVKAIATAVAAVNSAAQALSPSACVLSNLYSTGIAGNVTYASGVQGTSMLFLTKSACTSLTIENPAGNTQVAYYTIRNITTAATDTATVRQTLAVGAVATIDNPAGTYLDIWNEVGPNAKPFYLRYKFGPAWSGTTYP